MAAPLGGILLTRQNQPKVIDDCITLVQQELADKSGVSANALKLSYKTVTSFAPGYLRHKVEEMLPQIVQQLEPFWTDFNAVGDSDFGDYLAKRGEKVSEALLSVSDAHAQVSERPVIVKAYQAIRGGALKHVEAALPRVGQLVLKYTP